MNDVIIIGAGVIGCAIARELSKYQLKIAVIEKDYDVANGASKANSGIIHAGEDPIPGTLKAKMNIKGNPMFDKLQKELNFPFRRNGSFVLCLNEKDLPGLEALRDRGLENGMDPSSMSILTRDDALKLEPHLSDSVTHVLFLKTGGIISPYEFTIALAENAAMNGVSFSLNSKVEKIEKENDHFILYTSKGLFESKLVINAAGLYSDELNNMLSSITYHITPRRGEYILLDKVSSSLLDKTLFQLPTKMGKGILVTPTVHGNILLGPTATDSLSKDNVDTTAKDLEIVTSKAVLSLNDLPLNTVITSFSGLRAHEDQGDFILGEAPDVPGFINVLGIESPGLTSSPAIAEYITELVIRKTGAAFNPNFNPIRPCIPVFAEATEEEKHSLIKDNPLYGQIVCRCESITQAEILQAIHRPIGATTLDGIKRRTRAGMGRCQNGFCMNKIIEILVQELNISPEEVQKNKPGSTLLVSDLKADLDLKGGKANV